MIPPGIHLGSFRPPRRGDRTPAIAGTIDRFLHRPKKPMILALQRPDERKNLATLLRAYGENEALREIANLVLLIGIRDDITEAPIGQRRVLEKMLRLIDRWDLYGSVAYPKQHAQEDVPDIYRLAAKRRGVFVNPALTEPFGLTLIEAAASGLPIVATKDGGPKSIVELCRNGVLVDPLHASAIADALLRVLTDRARWRRLSRAGIRGSERHFSWQGHVNRFLTAIRKVQRRRSSCRRRTGLRDRLVTADRLLVCDIDNTLLGDEIALKKLLSVRARLGDGIAFGVATGRTLKSARDVLDAWRVPAPDVFVTAVGSEIHYGPSRVIEDSGWRRFIDHSWEPERLRTLLHGVPGLTLQPDKEQRQFKLSYFVDTARAPGVKNIRRRLKESGLKAQVVFSHGRYLDLLPHRASKGAAVRFLATLWGLNLSNVLVAGDSGNDTEMLRSGALAVVVGNHSQELEEMRADSGVYFARASYAAGIMEGIEHFGFVKGLFDEREMADS